MTPYPIKVTLTIISQFIDILVGAPVAQWFKGLPADLADQGRSLLEAKSSLP